MALLTVEMGWEQNGEDYIPCPFQTSPIGILGSGRRDKIFLYLSQAVGYSPTSNMPARIRLGHDMQTNPCFAVSLHSTEKSRITCSSHLFISSPHGFSYSFSSSPLFVTLPPYLHYFHHCQNLSSS